MECCMYITAHGGYCVDMKVLCGWGDLISLINTKLPFILRGETMTCKKIKRIIIIVFIIMAGNKYINLLLVRKDIIIIYSTINYLNLVFMCRSARRQL